MASITRAGWAPARQYITAGAVARRDWDEIETTVYVYEDGDGGYVWCVHPSTPADQAGPVCFTLEAAMEAADAAITT